MMNPPFLNGSSSPVRLRVPSGKIRNELPARSDSAPRGDRRHRLVAIAAFDRDEPADVEHRAHDRELAQLRLVEDVELRVQRLEQHRRVDVALVVRAEHDRRSRGTLLAARHPVPDAGQRQRQPDAAVPQRVHPALPAEHDRR